MLTSLDFNHLCQGNGDLDFSQFIIIESNSNNQLITEYSEMSQLKIQIYISQFYEVERVMLLGI